MLFLRLTRLFARPFARLYFRLEIRGLENLPDDTPVILAPNHQSHLDSLLIASALRARTLRKTFFFAKEKHFRSWYRRVFANNSHVIVMKFGRELRESLQRVAAVLRSGRNMVIFPEGTRSKDGTLSNFKRSFAILSKEMDVPVVPVAIRGAYRSLKSGRFIPRPVKIQLDFLEPIRPQGFGDYAALVEATKRAIQDASIQDPA